MGNRIFLTCFTGYAVSSREPGEISRLKRHLICLDATDGKILWNTATPAEMPEQERIREDHGYASSTPAADAERIYAFYGKSGLLAFDHSGKQLWHVVWKINKGSNVPSPLLHEGHLYFAHENLGVVYCVNAQNGDLVYEERLEPSPGQIYASPTLAEGRIYYIGRGGRTVTIAAQPKFQRLAESVLESGRGVFNSSPAFHGKRMLLRSNRALYCLGK